MNRSFTKKIIKQDVFLLEKFFDFILHNRGKVYIVILLLIMMSIINKTPYVNLFFVNYEFLIYYLSVTIVFDFKAKKLNIIAVLSFLGIAVLSFLGINDLAEKVGNFTYMILLTTIFIYVRGMIKTDKVHRVNEE